MSVKCDINKLNNNVIPLMKKSVKDLEKANGILLTIGVPYDFICKREILSIGNTISNVKANMLNTQKWVEQVAEKFNQAESKNMSVVSQLLNGTKNQKNIFEKNIRANSKRSTMQHGKMSGVPVTQLTMNASTYKVGLDLFNDASQGIKNVGTYVTSACQSFFNDTIKPMQEDITNKFETVVNGINNLKDELASGLESIGANISSGWESFCNSVEGVVDKVLDTGANIFLSTGSDLVNVLTALTEGIGKFGESLFDTCAILGTGAGSIITGGADLVTYLTAVINNDTESWNSLTADLWKETMAFVATDYVGNAFDDFYESSIIWQLVDKYAHAPFKRGGIATGIAEGLGYVAGTIVLTLGTAGVGSLISGTSAISSTAIGSIVTGIGSFGKYTEEFWANARDSSWDGIKEKYRNGEITQEDYEQMCAIRNLQWGQIEEARLVGKITQEEYEYIRIIRNIPEEWQTFEVGLGGIDYGAYSAIWESLQWYVGGNMDKWTKSLSKLTGATTRIGIDTIFNTVDTPFRAGLEALLSGESFEESWQNQGGWASLLMSTGVGLLGSVGGEIFNNIKLKKADVNSNNLNSSPNGQAYNNSKIRNLEDAINETLLQKGNKTSREYIIQEINKGNYSVITRANGARDFVLYWAKLQENMAYKLGYNADFDFSNYSSIGKYGVDQGILKDLYCFQTDQGIVIDAMAYKTHLDAGFSLEKYARTNEYLDIKKFIQTRYNMSAKDAAKIITALDSIGACSYAEICNEFANLFRSNELAQEFMSATGISIYKQIDGNWYLNDKELLIDLFMFANDTRNGGKLIDTIESGQKVVVDSKVITDQNRVTNLRNGDAQQYFMYYAGMNENLVNRYLQSNGISERYVTKTINNVTNTMIDDNTMSLIKQYVIDEMQKGGQIGLYVSSRGSSDISFVDISTGSEFMNTARWNEGGAHAVYVTGYNDIGVIVSSWGKRLEIPWDDLQSSGGFAFFSSKLSSFETKGLWDKIKDMFR